MRERTENEAMHLSDAELLMSADGELSRERSARARAHLDSCWTCRARMQTLEVTVTDFVRARNAELEGSIPPGAGPRALLRARMRELAAPENAGARGLMGRLTAAAACLCVVAGALLVFELAVNAEGPRPNARVTPGETRPITLAEVCSNPEAEVVVRHISAETKQQVLNNYGIKPGRRGDFEVDFLITPDLGGAETTRNLWPQPYSARWNAGVKDKLEQRLHDLVCSGRIDLPTAQREIASDWIGAYRKYVTGDRH